MAGNLVIDNINNIDISVSPVATQDYVNNRSIGVNQTWQDVTAFRAAGTTYTNSTGKTIVAEISTSAGNGAWNTHDIYVNGIIVKRNSFRGWGDYSLITESILVPNNATYKIVVNSNSIVPYVASTTTIITSWNELR